MYQAKRIKNVLYIDILKSILFHIDIPWTQIKILLANLRTLSIELNSNKNFSVTFEKT